jgi:predicted Zn-dependent protease
MPRAQAARALLLLLLPALAATGCATNPATGRSQLSFFGEEAELAMGRDVAEEIAASGAVYGDEELAGYVAEVGGRLAEASERPYLPWSFQVLDDPGINAFALPGGWVYVTRGILAHLESEAELAAVLGHEIGHVTARHSVNQMSKQILASAALLAASIHDEDIARWAGLGELGLGLMFLQHGRSDERQADDLGLRYVLRAGYDPQEMPELFAMLERVGEAAAAGGLPTWLSSHPDPGARRVRIAEEVSRLQAAGAPLPERIEREGYLERIAGLPYGPDPGLAAAYDAGATETGLADGGDGTGGAFLGTIALARVEESMSIEELVSRHASPGVPAATVALLNRFPADGIVPAGSLAKMVVLAGSTSAGKTESVFRKDG